MIDLISQPRQYPIEQCRSGYYEVGDKHLVNKSQALAQAAISQTYPKWRFHDAVWGEQSWTGEANTNDLYELYQDRARQLRQNYDYICLAFSGGADSTTMLQAFVDGGLHVDEILVRWPIKATEKYLITSDRAANNFISEWHLTMVPLIEHYQKLLEPRTKFTILDWSDQIVGKTSSEELIWNTQDFFNPTTYVKHTLVTDSTKHAIESGKKTCVLYGVDRPLIAQTRGHVFCYFQDIQAHTQLYGPWEDYCEFFYWTPDFPTIVPYQARIIFQHLSSHPDLLRLISGLPGFPSVSVPPNSHERLLWLDIMRSLIYPKYFQQRWFQAFKSGSRIDSDSDLWMLENPELSQYVQSWKSHVQNRLGCIDKKFLAYHDKKVIGYLGFLGSVHRLGFIPEPIM